MVMNVTYAISAKTIHFTKSEVFLKLLKGEAINKRLRIMDTKVHVHMDLVESLGNILYTLKDRKRKQIC